MNFRIAGFLVLVLPFTLVAAILSLDEHFIVTMYVAPRVLNARTVGTDIAQFCELFYTSLHCAERVQSPFPMPLRHAAIFTSDVEEHCALVNQRQTNAADACGASGATAGERRRVRVQRERHAGVVHSRANKGTIAGDETES